MAERNVMWIPSSRVWLGGTLCLETETLSTNRFVAFLMLSKKPHNHHDYRSSSMLYLEWCHRLYLEHLSHIQLLLVLLGPVQQLNRSHPTRATSLCLPHCPGVQLCISSGTAAKLSNLGCLIPWLIFIATRTYGETSGLSCGITPRLHNTFLALLFAARFWQVPPYENTRPSI